MPRRALAWGALLLGAASAGAASKGTAIVVVLPPGSGRVTLSIDGQRQPTAAGPHAVSPGSHTVLAQQAGHPDFFLALSVSPGQVRKVEVAFEAGLGLDISSDQGVSIKRAHDGARPQRHRPTPPKPASAPRPPPVVAAPLPPAPPEPPTPAPAPAASEVPRVTRAPSLKPAPSATPQFEDTDLSAESARPPRQRPTAWYGHWYTWAGAGAVVAGVVAGVLVAGQVHGHPALTATQVCGGPCDIVVNGP